MSLADELLADYEEAGGEVVEEEADIDMSEVADVAEVEAEVDYSSKDSVRTVAKLRDSHKVCICNRLSHLPFPSNLVETVLQFCTVQRKDIGFEPCKNNNSYVEICL